MQLLEFITNHWPLVAAFIVLLLLILAHEMRAKIGSALKVTPHEATQLINKEDAFVVDLRDDLAFQKGHIIGAKPILPANLLTYSFPNKERPILLTCQSGYQSPTLGRQLRKLGFTQVYYLAGGIDNWLNSGLLLIKGK